MPPNLPTIIAIVFVVAFVAVVIMWKPLMRRHRQKQFDNASRAFKSEREQLEAKFFEMAASKGLPRGLNWVEIDWLETLTFARSSDNGLLTAFVGINIHFEAVEGGDMEDVEAVGTVRDAVALFHYGNQAWGTGGKALFNMNPAEVLVRLDGQFVPVDPLG